MSSRDIEGDNPLYLPQAKVYDQSCSIGPWIALYDELPQREAIGIHLEIRRDEKLVFEGNTSVAEMARTFDELTEWLFRDLSFPHGVFLMTGTGIVPSTDFSLRAGDIINITIDGVGILSNTVVQRNM